MDAKRSQKLERLVRVQRQLERMAENELAHTLREQAAADAARQALIDAMGSLETVHRVMAGHYATRFTTVQGRIRTLSGVQAMQERRVLIEKTKADRLDDAARQASLQEEREEVDEGLLDLLDTTLRTRTSLA